MIDKITIITEAEILARLKAKIETNLYEIPPGFSFLNNSKLPTTAAVLIPLLKKPDGWHLLFTRRNSNLPEHSGQVSFPGGRTDPHDQNAVKTALREASEEIGLNPIDVTVLGLMPEFHTITNYQVTPVVGVVPVPYQFTVAPDGVSRVFTIPLFWLADPQNYNIHNKDLPDTIASISVIYFKEYDGEILWGASARIVLSFIKLISE